MDVLCKHTSDWDQERDRFMRFQESTVQTEGRETNMEVEYREEDTKTKGSCTAYLTEENTSTAIDFCAKNNADGEWHFRYLPDLALLGEPQGFPPRSVSKAFLLALNRLHHSNASCVRAPLMPTGGFGYGIEGLLNTFAYSFSIGVPQTFDSVSVYEGEPRSTWHLADNTFCLTKTHLSWHCYFEQVSNCSSNQYPRDWYVPAQGVDGEFEFIDFERHKETGTSRHGELQVKGFERYDKLWASAMILHFFWKLQPRLVAAAGLNAHKKRLSLSAGDTSRQWIGVHVRRGDSPSETHVPWSEYLRAAEQIRTKYCAGGGGGSPRTRKQMQIFLATDDAGVVDECKSDKTVAAGFACHTAPVDRGVYDVPAVSGVEDTANWTEERMKRGELTTDQMEGVSFGVFLDWELLSECSYFIVNFDRSFFRIPFYLHVSKRHEVPPVISRAPWDTTEFTTVILQNGASTFL